MSADPERTPPEGGDEAHREEDEPDMGDLFDELEELEDIVDSDAEREQVRDAMRVATEAQEQEQPVFGRVVWGFDRADLAEAMLGALLFGIPMTVEGGTNEVGEFLAVHPLLLVGTMVATVAIVVGILYVAEIQDVRVAYALFGLIPRRLVAVLGTSAVVSLVMLTAWGRVDWGADPLVAGATCAAAALPMAVGAALGDILPGS